MSRTLARTLEMEFRRIQFTPDLMPSDITGMDIIEEDVATGHRKLEFLPGPIFANFLLADEINRTPPKTQSALLQAMQENEVTIGRRTYPLKPPFFVVATQNPIDMDGTYALPEAQLDRFLMKVEVGYPDEETERAILLLRHRGVAPATLGDVQPVLDVDELKQARYEVDSTGVSDEVVAYVASIVRETRNLPSVELGASPRAAVHMLAAARAYARLDDRGFVTPDDVAAVAHPVLRHRLILHAEAELERYRPDDAVDAVLQAVPVPR
jgi:MoxR-like ATPase